MAATQVLAGVPGSDEIQAMTAAARGLEPVEWVGALGELDRAIAGLTAARSALVMKARASEQWRRGGYASFEAWLGAISNVGTGKARNQVRVAGVLETQPEVAGAVTSGEVTLVHAEVIARVSDGAARTPKGELKPTEQQELLKLAKSSSADEFDKAAQRLMARRDRPGHDASHEELRRRRFFSVSATPTGTHVKGFLDPVAGHSLKLALEAATARPGKDDERTYEQRQADALVDLAAMSLNSGDLKPGAQVRPHVSVIMTEESFAGSRTEMARRRAAAESAGEDGEGEAGPATFEDGTPIPPSELSRILCDAELTRVVVDADSVPLNLGRTTRLFSKELRRAVIFRDRSCRFVSCDRPARWCEVHHIEWWEERQGQTSLENGILLCRFHHGQVHNGNLSVIPGPHPTAVPTAMVNQSGYQNRAVSGPSARSENLTARGDKLRLPAPSPSLEPGTAASREQRPLKATVKNSRRTDKDPEQVAAPLFTSASFSGFGSDPERHSSDTDRRHQQFGLGVGDRSFDKAHESGRATATSRGDPPT